METLMFRGCVVIGIVGLVALLLFHQQKYSNMLVFQLIDKTLEDDNSSSFIHKHKIRRKTLKRGRVFLEFLQFCAKNRLRLVLLNATLLKNARNLSMQAISKLPVLSFGITEEDSLRLAKAKENSPPSWAHYLLSVTDPRYISPVKAQHRHVTLENAHQFVFFPVDGHSLIVHLATLVTRGSTEFPFYWVSKIPWESLSSQVPNNTNLMQSLHQWLDPDFGVSTAFPVSTVTPLQPISALSQTSSDSLLAKVIFLPKDTDSFLWRRPFSDFQECPFETAWEFNRRNPLLLQESERATTDNSLSKAINLFQNFLDSLKVPVWIFGGTLLGWYRQCGFISYTSDLDFSTNISYYSPQFFSKLRKSKDPKLKVQFGKPDDHFELSFYSRGKKVDLFFQTPSKGADGNWGTYAGGQWPAQRKRLRWYYPPFPGSHFVGSGGICSAELLGNLVFIPCNPLEFIKADYGAKDWKVPRRNYVWFKSHKNVVQGNKFTSQEWNSRMYQEFP